MDYPLISYRESTAIFGPEGPSDQIMERCEALAQVAKSVPYKVSMRFAFYRLWEKRSQYFPKLASRTDLKPGKAKELAYERCCKSFSKAVHGGYFDADTFEDQKASFEIATGGSDSNKVEWLQSVLDWRIGSIHQYCDLDNRQDQDRQVIFVFEAAAMWAQFQYYSKDYPIDLWSLGGQASNPHKYGLASRINSLGREYPDSKITICYFGDLDDHGIQIPQTALGDVEQWARSRFESYRIGVNTSPPGQWEAYSDHEAGEIIAGAIKHFLDIDKLKAWEGKSRDVSRVVNKIIDNHVDMDGLKKALLELLNDWNK